jgi:AraC family transcriptional regulator
MTVSLERLTTLTPRSQTGRTLRMTWRDFEQWIPRAALRDAAAQVHGTDAQLAVPPAITLDRPLLALLRTLRHTAREARDATARHWLIRAAAAHVIQTRAVASGPQPGSAAPAPRPPCLSERKLRQVERYIQSSLAGALRIKDIACHAGLSRSRFACRFKASTGMTAHQFMTEIRIRTAKTLLAGSGLRLAQIAARIGFASVSHFSSVFRRLVKMAPSDYRRQVALGAESDPPAPLPQRLPAIPASAPPAVPPSPGLAEFELEQTSLRIDDQVRLLHSSLGRGWPDLFAAVTDEAPHENLHGGVPAVWVATTDSPSRLLRIGAAGRHRQTLPGCAVVITGATETVYDQLAFPLKARHIYLRQSVIDDAARQMFKGSREQRFIQSAPGAQDFVLYRLIAAIRDTLNEPLHDHRLKLDCLTQALAAHLLARHSIAGALRPLPTPALNARQIGELGDYINANLASGMSLDELCRVVGLGRSQFIERFKATTAMPPHQFVTLRRISHARQLLTRPNADHAWIALLCGFAHPSHVTATFKRVTGMTPGEYQRMAG